MPEVTVTLQGVDSREVSARGETTTVYKFKGSDGKSYDTFKRDVAVPGSQLRGRLVTIEYEEVKKGDYTNYKLIGIVPADTGVILPEESPPAYTLDPASPTQEKKDVSIARAVALKAAVESVGSLDFDRTTLTVNDIISIADTYVGWLLTGASNPFADLAVNDTEFVKF